MTRPERALAIHDQQYGHSVTFAGLDGGRILLLGGRELRVSDDGGVTWGEPYPLVDHKGEPLRGSCPCLVKLADRALGLATMRTRPGALSDEELEMVFRTSEDEGRSWSPPVVMNRCMRPAHALQDVMIRTESGRLVLPVYFRIGQRMHSPYVGGYLNGNFVSTGAHFYDPHFPACYVLYSDDGGRSWQPNRDGELFIVLDEVTRYCGAAEPSVVEVTPGRLMMIARTKLGRLFQAWSGDDGETWSRLVPSQLAGTQAPGQIRRLPGTGHLLVVWTQQSHEEVRKGFIRTRLSSAISRNGGGVWEHFQNVESLHEETHVEPGPIEVVRPEACYPMAQSAALQCDPKYAVPLPEGYGRWSYPSVFVAEDRVLISHCYSPHDPRTGEVSTPPGSTKLKVLPISWFYGDDDPERESPILKKISTLPPAP